MCVCVCALKGGAVISNHLEGEISSLINHRVFSKGYVSAFEGANSVGMIKKMQLSFIISDRRGDDRYFFMSFDVDYKLCQSSKDYMHILFPLFA